MDENTRLIVNACKLVVRCAKDSDDETFTVPKTTVQAIRELDCLFDNIRPYNKEEAKDRTGHNELK